MLCIVRDLVSSFILVPQWPATFVLIMSLELHQLEYPAILMLGGRP